jgi:hypothetical protein
VSLPALGGPLEEIISTVTIVGFPQQGHISGSKGLTHIAAFFHD